MKRATLKKPIITPLGKVALIPRGRSGRGESLYNFDQLSPGECLSISGRSYGTVAAAVYRHQKMHGGKFAIRKGRGKDDSVKVWRLS